MRIRRIYSIISVTLIGVFLLSQTLFGILHEQYCTKADQHTEVQYESPEKDFQTVHESTVASKCAFCDLNHTVTSFFEQVNALPSQAITFLKTTLKSTFFATVLAIFESYRAPPTDN